MNKYKHLLTPMQVEFENNFLLTLYSGESINQVFPSTSLICRAFVKTIKKLEALTTIADCIKIKSLQYKSLSLGGTAVHVVKVSEGCYLYFRSVSEDKITITKIVEEPQANEKE